MIIGDYIADFACLAQKLIIEVDGGYHSTESQMQEDELRTQVLNRLGFRVIRFTNEEVMYDTETVLDKIRAIITAPPSEAAYGTSVSLPKREGENVEDVV